MSRVVVPVLALLLALLTAVATQPAYANKPLLRTRSVTQPPKAQRPLTSAKAAKPARPSPNQLRAERLGMGTVKAAALLLSGRTELSWVRAAGGSDALPGTLRFPVGKGYVGRGFGSGKGGYHQAIDIGGEIGLPVRAASAGVVAYAGNQINGYGNMVIVVHAGGAITTYAHNQKNLVEAGQRVTRGTVLAQLGSTGRSKGPHVHFELLFAGKNCDPMPLFRPTPTRKNGQPAGQTQSVWRDASKRPKSIKCAPRKHHPDYVSRPEVEGDGDADEPGSDLP